MTRRSVDGVQALVESGVIGTHRLGHDIQRIGRRIDHRCAGHPDLRREIAAPLTDQVARHASRHRGLARAPAMSGVQQIHRPQRHARIGIGVEGEQPIVLGRDQYHVMACAIDRHIGNP